MFYSVKDERQGSGTTTLATPTEFIPSLGDIDTLTRRQMVTAGHEILECQRVLHKGGLNLVGEVLRGQGQFFEMEHYPQDDVFDKDNGSQYYYHAHRGPLEHGHFHTFLRRAAIPSTAHPIDWPLATEAWPQNEQAVCHLVAISMDAWGAPISIFTTNRWVTAESWYPAEDLAQWLPRFRIDHAWPSWPLNRWLTAMLQLYQPFIKGLLHHRDAVMREWIQQHPGEDVFEDRNLEIIGSLTVNPEQLISDLEASFKA